MPLRVTSREADPNMGRPSQRKQRGERMKSISTPRQRADGSWTFTTETWDAKWYWPLGTRVRFRQSDGTVTKQNNVSVDVRFDTGMYAGSTRRVSVTALERLPIPQEH
jgi:hypothetical protein